jgi:type II secretory pathway component PulM
MSTDSLGQLGPPAVAFLVIAYLLLVQPLSSQLGGISMNLVGAAVVAVGGILGFVE